LMVGHNNLTHSRHLLLRDRARRSLPETNSLGWGG
jgi:hypothetical protein